MVKESNYLTPSKLSSCPTTPAGPPRCQIEGTEGTFLKSLILPPPGVKEPLI